ncbi:MAG TPA: TrmH family RNA methyltransferase [Actinomycetota bacterium]
MITSIHNKGVARAVRLKKRAMREKDRLFLVEGAQGVSEAVASRAGVQEVFTTAGTGERLEGVVKAAEQAGIPVRLVSAEVMAHLTSTVTPQGVVAVSGFVDVPLQEVIEPGEGMLPVLVEVRDPGNAGTILRSADASGAAGVVFTTSSVDVYNQKTVRATAGSLFHLPVAREVGVDEAVSVLRDRGFAVLAADAEGTRSVYEANLSTPTAVLFGNEAHGLSASALALADHTVRVPISGNAESLNLAAAATLVLFEAARQRAAAGVGTDILSRIVAGAAHDIRSPLTAMKGFTSTLLSKWQRLDDEQRLAMIEGVAGDAFRMEAVIAQLVDAARLHAGSLDLAPVPTDMQEIARRIQEEVGRWSQIELEVTGSAAIALVDPARLRSMLLALIESAQWWGETGPVHVETNDDPAPAVVVRRAGSELEPTVRDGLFHPRMPGSGSGSKVGLYVAKGLAEAHGGTLRADTSDGIAFILTLPPGPG